MRGNSGFGCYFARTISDSQTFGDITYKVRLLPKHTLIFNDNEVKGKGFFNMSKEMFDKYSKHYDSIRWNQKGKLKEFLVLNTDIIKSYELI